MCCSHGTQALCSALLCITANLICRGPSNRRVSSGINDTCRIASCLDLLFSVDRDESSDLGVSAAHTYRTTVAPRGATVMRLETTSATHPVLLQHRNISLGQVLAVLLRVDALSSITLVQFVLDQSDLHRSDPRLADVLGLGVYSGCTISDVFQRIGSKGFDAVRG